RLGFRREVVRRPAAPRRVGLEAEVRELDRDMRGELPGPDAVEDHEVVLAHRFGVGGGAYLLAELRHHATDAALGERGGGVEGGAEVFPRPEAAAGAAGGRAAAGLLRG